jgi:hypothetical protein
MHIFQCIKQLGQDFVDDILAAKAGKYPGKNVETRVPAFGGVQRSATQGTAYDNMHAAESAALAASRYQAGPPAAQMFRQSMQRDGWQPRQQSASPSEATQRGVTLLDRCFTDIEQFVSRIQQAANAFRELDNRRSVRINKFAQQYGDGLLGMRSRPPPAKDFIDILQKFKLSFILLARLKSQIRDPNAPELVHFLFTPLSLVIDASRGDTQTSGVPAQLASRVVAPLPTPEAHDLLDNCLTSKENELLRSLGPAWTLSIDRWRGEVPPYIPQFHDGWQPPAFWLEEIGVPTGGITVNHHASGQYRDRQDVTQLSGSDLLVKPAGGYARSQGSDSSSIADREMRSIEMQKRLAQDFQKQREMELSRDVAKLTIGQDHSSDHVMADRIRGKSPEWDRTDAGGADQNRRSPPAWGRANPDRDQAVVSSSSSSWQAGLDRHAAGSKSQPNMALTGSTSDDRVRPMPELKSASEPTGGSKVPAALPPAGSQDFIRELKARGAKIYKVAHEREAKNPKELSVKSGDILEILDDQKNWWKARNASGTVGFVPKTILNVYTTA